MSIFITSSLIMFLISYCKYGYIIYICFSLPRSDYWISVKEEIILIYHRVMVHSKGRNMM